MKKIQKLDDITAADWEDIKRRREQGANLDQVGELYGITGGALARYARLAGVDIPRRTEYNPLPSIEDIQRLRTDGMKWADIAAKLRPCIHRHYAGLAPMLCQTSTANAGAHGADASSLSRAGTHKRHDCMAAMAASASKNLTACASAQNLCGARR